MPKIKRPKSRSEIKTWAEIRQTLGGDLCIERVAELTELPYATLWRRHKYGGMTVAEYDIISDTLKAFRASRKNKKYYSSILD